MKPWRKQIHHFYAISAKGPKETLWHYSTERHRRKGQRWRYEHLTIEDPLTKKPRYQVRGRDGKLLSNYQVQHELPKFIDAELVDIGEKLLFYHEAIAGADYSTSSLQNWARLQISALGHVLPITGDVIILRAMWKNIGRVLNHQALFCSINWSADWLSVSSLSCSNEPSVFLVFNCID